MSLNHGSYMINLLKFLVVGQLDMIDVVHSLFVGENKWKFSVCCFLFHLLFLLGDIYLYWFTINYWWSGPSSPQPTISPSYQLSIQKVEVLTHRHHRRKRTKTSWRTCRRARKIRTQLSCKSLGLQSKDSQYHMSLWERKRVAFLRVREPKGKYVERIGIQKDGRYRPERSSPKVHDALFSWRDFKQFNKKNWWFTKTINISINQSKSRQASSC